jgi:hypothetical protein
LGTVHLDVSLGRPGRRSWAGYLIYISGHQKVTAATSSLADGDEAGELVAGARAKGQERSWGSRSLLLAAWDNLFPVAVRAGHNYLLHLLEQQFSTRPADQSRIAPPAGERVERVEQ